MRHLEKFRPILSPLAAALVLVLLLVPRPEEPALPASAPAQPEEPILVALTFDDGPSPATTPLLLDGLARRGVKATFFLIGQSIPGNEDLVRRMAAEGHQIGVHTYDHLRLTGLSDADFRAQVGPALSLLLPLTGGEELLLRPPYGMVDDGVTRRAELPILLWSVDPEDWKVRDAAKVSEHLLSAVGDGDVILLHDIYPTSVQAALDTVDALHRRGVRFVTVAELARQRGVDLEPGKVYRRFPPPEG